MMITRDEDLLQDVISSIMMENPQGLNHVQLVKAILETGYTSEDNTISEDVMTAVKRMIKKKMIHKNHETRIIKFNQ